MERAHRQAGDDGRRGCHSDPIFAQVACALLFFALAWLLSSARVRATGPVDHRILAADSGPGLLSAHSVRPPLMLTGGGRGPYLSVVDLSAYATPQPVPHSRTTRPVWKRYPVELADARLPARVVDSERAQYLAQHEIRHGAPHAPYLALTFDCEAGVRTTRQILNTLARENVRATFFVLGRYAYNYPEIVREIVAGGHELGSHSFFHPLFTQISPISATLEITYTEAAIARALGRPEPMRFFRFPYGGRSLAARTHLAAWGYQSVFWDLDPRGWEPGTCPEDVASYMEQRAHPGGIAILHCSSHTDADALPDVIRILRAKGIEPVPLSAIVSKGDRDVSRKSTNPEHR